MPQSQYSPDDLLARYRSIRNAVSDETFFRNPAHKKTQELWCAAHFACAFSKHVVPCSVLVADQDLQTEVDFELQVAGTPHPFQITEVQSPGRRRGEEYRAFVPGVFKEEDWSEGTANGAEWIRSSIHRKLIRYGGAVAGLNLLVYVNFPAWEQQYETIRANSASVASNFASVWLLNGNAMCCIRPSATLPSFEGWLVIPESLSHDET